MSEQATGKPVSARLKAAREEVYRRREARKARIADLQKQVDAWSHDKANQNQIRVAALEKCRKLQSQIDVSVDEIEALKKVKDVIPTEE